MPAIPSSVTVDFTAKEALCLSKGGVAADRVRDAPALTAREQEIVSCIARGPCKQGDCDTVGDGFCFNRPAYQSTRGPAQSRQEYRMADSKA
jgi:hypothetical protein